MNIENSKIVNQTFDVAVVIPTIIRSSLIESVRSIFNQSFSGTLQILIGIDRRDGSQKILDFIMNEAPPSVTVTIVDPGYSTSSRHGGIHTARDGGSLRTVLSFLANSRYVAYLDDDNWWHPKHLETLLEAINGVDWAFSYRQLIDDKTNNKMGIDKWHSVGPGKGLFKEELGGFVDPNTLMVDKLACADQLHLWSSKYSNSNDFSGADCRVFQGLVQNKSWNSSNRVTANYKLRRGTKLWQLAIEELARQQKKHSRNRG